LNFDKFSYYFVSRQSWKATARPALARIVVFAYDLLYFCFVSLPPKESFLTRDGETKGKRNFSRRALNSSLLTRLADISSGYAKQVYSNRVEKRP
jgi:hypothetical protein